MLRKLGITLSIITVSYISVKYFDSCVIDLIKKRGKIAKEKENEQNHTLYLNEQNEHFENKLSNILQSDSIRPTLIMKKNNIRNSAIIKHALDYNKIEYVHLDLNIDHLKENLFDTLAVAWNNEIENNIHVDFGHFKYIVAYHHNSYVNPIIKFGIYICYKLLFVKSHLDFELEPKMLYNSCICEIQASVKNAADKTQKPMVLWISNIQDLKKIFNWYNDIYLCSNGLMYELTKQDNYYKLIVDTNDEYNIDLLYKGCWQQPLYK